MKILISVLLSLVSVETLAAGAVGYTCVGKNKVNDEAVGFDLLFSDSVPKLGYANQLLTITKTGADHLEEPVKLQMFGVTVRSACLLSNDGETNMDPANFSMMPTENELGAYQVKFKLNCGPDANFDVQATCFFE